MTIPTSRPFAATATVLALGGLSACGRDAPAEERIYSPEPIVTQPAPVQPGATTFAIGEEDGAYGPGPGDGGTVTTLAIGEEEGGYRGGGSDGFVTTFAIGEEDGTGPIPVEPDGGIGDGAGPIPGAEVEGDYERIYIEPIGGDPAYGGATTLAIGEEG